MGACASKHSWTNFRAPSRKAEGTEEYMLDASVGVQADVSSTAGFGDGRAQARLLGLNSKTAGESLDNVQIPRVDAASRRRGPVSVGPPDDSFEASRVETTKRLAHLQRSFKGNSSSAWAFASRKPSDAGDGYDTLGSAQSDRWRPSGSGDRDSASSRGWMQGRGAADMVALDSSRQECVEVAEQADVVPVGEDVGAGPEAALFLTALGAVATPCSDVGGASGDSLGSAVARGAVGAVGGALDGSCKGEGWRTSRREEPSTNGGGGFRTFSISASRGAMQSKPQIRDDHPFAALPTDADANTGTQMETDELTSLPLPNLIGQTEGYVGRVAGSSNGGGVEASGRGGGSGHRPLESVRGTLSSSGFRYSAASYVQLEPGTMSGGLAASRNSDLGYYLEEARLVAPPQGVQPVRHNLMDSPMVRQRAVAQAAREADAEVHSTPVVLEYVPSVVKSHPSRVNLLGQPSQKKRLLPEEGDEEDSVHTGGAGGGGDRAGAADVRRMEYTPNKGLSRKFPPSSPASQSGYLRPAPGSISRPLSPVNSRLSITHPAAPSSRSEWALPISPRGTPLGADGSERCFHITHTGPTAAAPAPGRTDSGGGSHSISYRRELLAAAADVAVTTQLTEAARRRAEADRRLSSSDSQVAFGAASLLLPQTPQLLALAAVGPAPSPSLDYQPRRGPRGVLPLPSHQELRPSAPQLGASVTPGRIPMQEGSGGSKLSTDVLGSAIWNGPKAAVGPAGAVALLASRTVSSGGGPRRGLLSSEGRGPHHNDTAAGDGAWGVDVNSLGNGGRAAGRAARLLATLQQMGAPTSAAPDVSPALPTAMVVVR